MNARFEAGEAVQTPFGKGVVREVRNGGRLLVDVSGRALEVKERDVSRLHEAGRRARPVVQPKQEESVVRRPHSSRASSEIDLHGLTVEEALARAEHALNDAILADVAQVRFIHGRSGGRIRAALHRKLREIPSVRHFRVDPMNEGVTIVEL
jgi:dsDNA-specific endonuclease/ATPase MutS2